jgi:hypothetical protein
VLKKIFQFSFPFFMNKPYQILLALGIAAASLSSCSRANYAVNTTATPASVAVEQPTALVTTRLVESAKPAEVAQVAAPAAVAAKSIEVAAAPAAKQVKPSLVERVLVKKVAKQLAKAQASHQSKASTEQTAASKTGRAAIIAVAGLVLILIGAAANVGIIATIGAIAFLVGLILVVIHLVSGD